MYLIMPKVYATETCKTCSGTGKIEKGALFCFDCKGTGRIETTSSEGTTSTTGRIHGGASISIDKVPSTSSDDDTSKSSGGSATSTTDRIHGGSGMSIDKAPSTSSNGGSTSGTTQSGGAVSTTHGGSTSRTTQSGTTDQDQTVEKHTIGEIVDEGKGFIEAGKTGAEEKITWKNLKNMSDTLYNILLVIGIIIAFIVGGILAIKFLTSSVEGQAEIKSMLVPYIIGCVVVFGSFTIWKIVVDILQS